MSRNYMGVGPDVGIEIDRLLEMSNQARYEGDHELADGLLFYMEFLLTKRIWKE